MDMGLSIHTKIGKNIKRNIMTSQSKVKHQNSRFATVKKTKNNVETEILLKMFQILDIQLKECKISHSKRPVLLIRQKLRFAFFFSRLSR